MIEFKNVLIIKLKHLGDVLTTSPLIGAIKSLWPDADISYLVNPGGEDLVRHHPDVKEVFGYPRTEGIGAQIGLIGILRKRRYDLVIETSGGDRGAFYAWASGAKTRVGYEPRKKGHAMRRWFLNKRVTTNPNDRHTVVWHLDTLRKLGVEPGNHPMSLHWPVEAEARVKTLLHEAGIDPEKPYAAVHPSSRWMFKAWRTEGNAEVIDHLAERGLPVVVTAAPEEKELKYVRDTLTAVKHQPLDLSGRLKLIELAALIGGAKVFFGVDSLPMHMAAAVNTPAVVLFGPSGEHMWGPWGEGHTVITGDCDHRPCGRDGCEGSKVSKCLMEITAEQVFPALDQIIEDIH